MLSSLYMSSRILQSSVGLLESSIESLDKAIADVPRLKKVLTTQKVFGLVPEVDLESAKRHLKDETHPQITYLVGKVEQELGRLKRKKASLENKLQLQQVRLTTAENGRESMGRHSINKGSVDDQKLAKLKLLQNKKERLKYSLSRINLQSTRARLSLIPSLPPQK